MAQSQWLWVGALLGVALLAPTARASFSPPKGGGYGEIWRLATIAEERAQMPGFAAFALAVATSESRGKNTAANTSESEARYACKLYEANADTRYKDNPHSAERWCFGSGGWFGFMPATALSGKAFRHMDPYMVFDPAASVAFLADYVRRVVNGYWKKLPPSCRNWLTIRRFMASNKVGLDCDETNYDRSFRVREKLGTNLMERGLPANMMYGGVTIGNWPGGWELYQLLASFEGDVEPAVLEEDIPDMSHQTGEDQ